MVAVPNGFVTDISKTPVDIVPTVAVITVGDIITKEVAGCPPNFTEVVPVKFVPVIVTTVPVPPAEGV
jgi:hypothetical protein